MCLCRWLCNFTLDAGSNGHRLDHVRLQDASGMLGGCSGDARGMLDASSGTGMVVIMHA